MDSDEQGRSTCGVRDLRDGPVRQRAAAAWRPTSIVCWWRLGDAGARRRGSAPRAGDAATAQQRATSTTLAATRRHPCRPGMVAADCAWFRPCPEFGRGAGGTERSPEFGSVDHTVCGLARARGVAPMMVVAARRELGGGERQHPGSTTALRGALIILSVVSHARGAWRR